MPVSSDGVWRGTQADRHLAETVWIRDSFVAAPKAPGQVLPVCLFRCLSRAHRSLRDPALRARVALHLRLWLPAPPCRTLRGT
jgi:hypothetical protein